MAAGLACLLALVPSAHAAVILTDDEIAAALLHGPWEADTAPDPSNRVSGDPRAIAFGETVFSDTALSVDGSLSCASCHDPARAFTDGRTRAVGQRRLDRNTLALFNQSRNRWFGWDGSTDNLWAQTILPILNPDEMAQSLEGVRDYVLGAPDRDSYTALFGDPAGQGPELVTVNLAKALAAYQETLTTGHTPFDAFRDALEAGDLEAAGTYPEAAQRGLSLFLGRGNCAFCHSGPMFSNGEFHDAGVPYFIDATRVDPGRFAGVNAVLDSPYTLDGDFSDDPQRTGAWAVRQVLPLHSDFGTFRVPGLRNVARTAPYMHDGSLPDLDAVISHYDEIDLERMHADGEAILVPLGLTEAERSDLVAFLNTLSDTP